jgi:hypothetical protein
MSKKSLIVLAAMAALSGAAFADDADPSGQFALQLQNSVSRAEVRADLDAALAKGQVHAGIPPAGSWVQPAVHSTKTRAEVTAEYLASRDEVAAMTGEDSGSMLLAKSGNAQGDREYLAGTPKRRGY